MGYKVITEEKIYEVFRGWHSGQTISQTEGLDRKTIRDYLQHFTNCGFTQQQPFPPRQELYAFIQTIMPHRGRRKSQSEKLKPYTDEMIFQ